MSHHEEPFEDTSSFINLGVILVALVTMPLLPMVMGWFTLLR